MMRAVITACGSYLPEKCVTNKDMEEFVDTNDEWIRQRTGIEQRHIAADDEDSADMAIAAARQAMERGGYTGEDIDGIIVATSTPNTTFPSVAVNVQNALGVPACPAFDVQAVCSGFIYALSVANSMMQTGAGKRYIVVGVEKMSSVLDWNDRTTCVLFGDGAGAVVLEAQEGGKGTIEDRGILSTHLYANGNKKDILYTTGGTSSTRDAGFIYMDGKEVFKYAVNYMSSVVEEVLEKNNIPAEDIDWLVPHQANIRILEAAAKKLNMSMDQVVVTLNKHGNTSAASIPLALCSAVDEGKIKKGDLILTKALGAGLTWGAVLLRF
jgi:3-oxoacyl-[acyl-carrier-protein] synthase-3